MPEKIGEFLIRIGVITQQQVQEVLDAQKAGDSRLFGDIAIEYGYINDEVLKKYIEAKAAWKK
ncbi:MAG: hypothetical protein JSV89_11320 [Spirochaetaceae bacterium]|nr:MAG: hypothetical protein JSV89_11320 [Spirochaetaceae bacterium]